MIYRHSSAKLLALSQQFPVLAILGPRQSGKTTLAKGLFPHLPYVSLEDLDQRDIATSDPRGFLTSHKDGAVIDEIQHVPELLSYLQTHVDQFPHPGRFIITGSENLTLSARVSQTLAGRIGMITLLPLSLEELKDAYIDAGDAETVLFRGLYPGLFKNGVDPSDWYLNYIRTYVERDVRQIKNITDLNRFQVFFKLCAGRTGQILNLSSLASDCGVSHVTARHWVSLLEASYLIYLLQPHYRNFNKRLIKAPKLYFHDTGLACALLGIEKPAQVQSHYLRGSLFENMVVNELYKYRSNQGKQPNLYFWRDTKRHEIDCVIENAGAFIPIEIKSSQTFSSDFLNNLQYLEKLSGQDPGYLVYNGPLEREKDGVKIVNFRNFIARIKSVL